jgi:hypothetical protein
MPNANAPLEFSGDQRATVEQLAGVMKGVAAVLLLLAAVNVAGGAITLFTVSTSGLIDVIAGLLAGLLGLVMLAAAADVRYMVETKYTSLHLGHAFQDLTMFCKTQFYLALFLILVGFVRLVAS